MTIGTPPLAFTIVKSGTSIQVVPHGGHGRVRSGQTINWTCDGNFSLLLRKVAYQLDSGRTENPAPPGVTHGWTAMASSHSHTVGEGPYFIKYWVMLEDPAVAVLDPGIIIDS
jgi:hypothetical protein